MAEELRSRTLTMRDLFGMGLERLGMEGRAAARQGGRLADLAQWTPLGALESARRAGQQGALGNLLGAGISAVGAVPFVPGAAKNTLKFGGKRVWGVVADRKTGEILHGVPYEDAAEWDFHHSFYLPEQRAKNIDRGREVLVWSDRGSLQSMEKLPFDLKETIRENLKTPQPPKALEDILGAFSMGQRKAKDVHKVFKKHGWSVDLRSQRNPIEVWDPDGNPHSIKY